MRQRVGRGHWASLPGIWCPSSERHNVCMADTQPSSADAAASGRGSVIERFSATPSRVVGLVVMAFAAFAAVDAARHGFSATNLLIIALAAFAASAAWMVLVRPRVTAYQRVVVIHNPASDIEIPWPLVLGAEARQTLRVYTADETFHAAGIVKSSRQITQAKRGPVIGSLTGTATQVPWTTPGAASRPPATYPDTVAQQLMTIAAQQRAAQQGGQIVRRWAIPELTALGLSALAAVVLFVSR